MYQGEVVDAGLARRERGCGGDREGVVVVPRSLAVQRSVGGSRDPPVWITLITIIWILGSMEWTISVVEDKEVAPSRTRYLYPTATVDI